MIPNKTTKQPNKHTYILINKLFPTWRPKDGETIWYANRRDNQVMTKTYRGGDLLFSFPYTTIGLEEAIKEARLEGMSNE